MEGTIKLEIYFSSHSAINLLLMGDLVQVLKTSSEQRVQYSIGGMKSEERC